MNNDKLARSWLESAGAPRDWRNGPIAPEKKVRYTRFAVKNNTALVGIYVPADDLQSLACPTEACSPVLREKWIVLLLPVPAGVQMSVAESLLASGVSSASIKDAFDRYPIGTFFEQVLLPIADCNRPPRKKMRPSSGSVRESLAKMGLTVREANQITAFKTNHCAPIAITPSNHSAVVNRYILAPVTEQQAKEIPSQMVASEPFRCPGRSPLWVAVIPCGIGEKGQQERHKILCGFHGTSRYTEAIQKLLQPTVE